MADETSLKNSQQTMRRRFMQQSLASLLAGSAIGSQLIASMARSSAQEGPQSELQPGSASQNDGEAAPLMSVQDHTTPWPNGWLGKEEIVMLMYRGFTALDLFGPHHMFILMMGAKVHLVAKTMDPVLTDTKIEVKPTMVFGDVPAKPTIFFVPGGTGGTLDAAKDDTTRNFVADCGGKSDWVTSVCTGSVLLGAAGLLKGYEATSHWITRDLLSDFGATPVDQRVVVDRNRITGAGVTSGLDFGLHMVKDLRSEEYAEAVQLFAEYDPTPPIDKGSQKKARPEISGLLMQMHEPFRELVRNLAK
jgi:cyclohexyl-isocyanide hydratase